MNFMIYLISLNIFSFLISYMDKRRAIKGQYRVPERVLISLSLLGGCFGMFLSMILFHHKTRKLKFKVVPFLCVLWGYILYSFIV